MSSVLQGQLQSPHIVALANISLARELAHENMAAKLRFVMVAFETKNIWFMLQRTKEDKRKDWTPAVMESSITCFVSLEEDIISFSLLVLNTTCS